MLSVLYADFPICWVCLICWVSYKLSIYMLSIAMQDIPFVRRICLSLIQLSALQNVLACYRNVLQNHRKCLKEWPTMKWAKHTSTTKKVGHKKVKAKKSLNGCYSITKNHSAASRCHKNGIALKSNFDFASLLCKCSIRTQKMFKRMVADKVRQTHFNNKKKSVTKR